MSLLYILLIVVVLMFKQQTKQLLDALIKLIIAISNSIVNGIK